MVVVLAEVEPMQLQWPPLWQQDCLQSSHRSLPPNKEEEGDSALFRHKWVEVEEVVAKREIHR